MALQMTYNVYGEPYTVYVRIEKPNIERNPELAEAIVSGAKYIMRPQLEVRWTKAKAKIDNWKDDKWICVYDTSNNADNAIKQCYAYLKTLPEFIAVTDVND